MKGKEDTGFQGIIRVKIFIIQSNPLIGTLVKMGYIQFVNTLALIRKP